MEKVLIVGLGNPGILYENTRHNIGFKVVKALAKKYKLEFKKDKKLKSKIAFGNILGYEVLLQLPLTYMNLSGNAVKAAKDYYKINLDKLLVVVDDADILFEEFKIKTDSGSGGHNGLKSIESSLNSQNYARLRVGIGKSENELKSHVLKRFTKEEKQKLDDIIDLAISFIEIWLEKGIDTAANKANIRLKKS
ncbi:MAG: aminoacyl-tRNA hydrolase [Parachlamydiales bacterium]|nr:aminoacyl-tRNA hydrolase [Parachlamydiales bacterium]